MDLLSHIFLVIQKGGEEGPSSRFVALVKNYFSLLEFPATEDSLMSFPKAVNILVAISLSWGTC